MALTPAAAMTVTAMINQKGGVGKTTDTLNLGGALAEYGRRVLLIDFDPQGNLSTALKVEHLDEDAPNSLPKLMIGGGDIRDAIIHPLPGIDLIPASLDMFFLPGRLREQKMGELRLQRLLAQIEGEYDHVLLDCRPAIDDDTDAALAAATDAVIPMDVDTFSIRAVHLLLAQAAKTMNALGRKPMDYRGIVINRIDRPFSDFNQSVYDALFTLPVPVKGEVPVRSKIAEAREIGGQPVCMYAPKDEAAKIFRNMIVSLGFVEAAA
ncbi:ParA family protein [Streptomyces sp. SP17BM10]|uniref:ParA family protein n=1 Tax=Streptomycetaceae TaxID=2062 RepID=UPI002E7716E6|nr:ParA family protein [Streptomyces sp. SP17BM10]MEE1783079.1 ParA family protein [Streptomyces sp. SP17BM10]